MDVEKELKASQEDFTKFPEKEAVGSPECDTPPVGKVGKSSSNHTGQVVVFFLMGGQRKCSSDSRSQGLVKIWAILAQVSRNPWRHQGQQHLPVAVNLKWQPRWQKAA